MELCQKKNVPLIAKLIPRPEVSLPKLRRKAQPHAQQESTDLSGNGLTWSSLDVFVSLFFQHLHSRSAHDQPLKNKRIGGATARILADALMDRKPQNCELDLSECDLGVEGALATVQLLAPEAENGLSVLKLAKNKLTDARKLL